MIRSNQFVRGLSVLFVLAATSWTASAQPDLSADKPWGPWKPDQFQAYCGTPAFKAPQRSSESDEDYANNRYFFEYKYNYHKAIKAGDKDPDLPGNDQQCLKTGFASHSDLKDEIENTLHEALVYISGMRSPLGHKFADPAHNRLGPVVIDDRHGFAVRVFADPKYKGIMQTYYRTWASNGPYDDRALAIISFNPERLSHKEWLRRFGFTHELMHMIQSKQASGLAWNEEKGSAPAHVKKTVRSPMARKWINEGIADAISRAFVHKTLGKQKPKLQEFRGGARNYYGLRRFDRGLTWLAKPGARDKFANARVPGYATSSFWRYIADRHYKGDYGFVIDMYRRKNTAKKPDDWLRWVDDFLDRPVSSGGIDASLYSVFPEFMANYVLWGDKKYKAEIGEDTWLSEVFWNDANRRYAGGAPGCHVVTLQPKEEKEISLSLQPFSGACFKVTVTGVAEGYLPAVHFTSEWTAGPNDKQLLQDSIHLSAARFINRSGGEENCYERQKREKVPGSYLCIIPGTIGVQAPHGTKLGGKTKSGKPQVLARPQPGKTFYQTWDARVTKADTESMYVLTYSPIIPRDRLHDVNVANKKEEDIVLKLSAMLTKTKTNLKKSGKGGTVDPGGKGIDPTGVPQQGVLPRPPKPQIPNQPKEPVGQYYVTGDMCREGICSVSLHDITDTGMQWLMPLGGDHVTLIFNKPIPFGSTGVFKTEDVAVAMQVGKGMKTDREGEGQVTIYQFDDKFLHLKVSGKYCLWDHVDMLATDGPPIASLGAHLKVHEQEEKRKCQDWRSFSGELIQSFGWMFDPDRRFTEIETPGSMAYREIYKKQAVVQAQAIAQKPKPPSQKQNPSSKSKGGLVPDDACKLVTKQEVEAVLGHPIVKVKETGPFCFYDAERHGAVQIALLPNELNETAQQTVDRFRAQGKDAEVVHGYGDSAYKMGGGMFGGNQLIAYKGDMQIIVTTMGQSPDKTERILDTLMRKALSRL